MKTTALLLSLFLILICIVPAGAVDDDPDEKILNSLLSGPESSPEPSSFPTALPSAEPTIFPSEEPTTLPSLLPTALPTRELTREITLVPTTEHAGPQGGWLSILSTPSGATVTIDLMPAGTTPVIGRELSAGDHYVTFTLDGYMTADQVVGIHAGEQASLDETLVRSEKPTPTPTRTDAPTPTPTQETTVTPTKTPGIPGGDKGWIKVNCNVDGATVSFDDLSSGCTVSGGSCTTEVTVTGTPFIIFHVQKPGYKPYSDFVTSWPEKGQTVNLYATLNPEPSSTTGTIQVSSTPSGAVATLDGGTWQYTPATFTAVPAGKSHSILITMSGYQPYSTSAYVTAGQTATVNAYLTRSVPQASSGSASVTTVPSGADVYVDNRFSGGSPAVIPGLLPGSHTIRIQKAGYDEYISSFIVNAGQTTPLALTLKQQAATVGSIEVQSTPPGAAVYLDGTFMGQTTAGNYLDLTSIRPGYHTVVLRQTDYQEFSQKISVKAGGIATVNANLVPLVQKTPDTTGQLVISSAPAGTDIFLDNIFKGITPATLADIPSGSHVLTLRKAGYADSIQTVMVTGGRSTPVSASLAETAPAKTETPLSVLPVLGGLLIITVVIALRRR